MSLRFDDSAAADLRKAIRAAGGVEVFAIGDVAAGSVTAVTITCRGTSTSVIALVDRPQSGQVVIHNHPSGVLHPSEADMALAGQYGDNGVGFVIVDSGVSASNWVVEPHAKREKAVDPQAIEAFFRKGLPRALPDFEARPGQIDMALEAGRALSENRPFVCEAGTGTGKSLAYLVPAALWALANDSKVVVSTFTKALQGQLLASDLPLLVRGGISVRSAVLQGRNNYVCKRRLRLVDEEERFHQDRRDIQAVLDWESTSADGSRGDLPIGLDPLLWERVESDADLTLRVQCPHYAECHFYQARRRAAAAHVVVVNHALLLSDLALRDLGVAGILPKYARLVLDEAHHLEDAATGAVTQHLTIRAVDRAMAPLLAGRKRQGALDRLALPIGAQLRLVPETRPAFVAACDLATRQVSAAREQVRAILEVVAQDAIPADGTPVRITDETEPKPLWTDLVAPRIADLANVLDDAAGALDAVTAPFQEVSVPQADMQPLLDVGRAHRRIAGYAAIARAFLEHRADVCRWLELARSRGHAPSAAVNLAPIEVRRTLQRILWDPLPGVVATSATMTVGGSFAFWLERSGLDESATAILPSPFDHATQAILALPRDLPSPDEPTFLAESAARVVDAVRVSDGGAFVLCTSYKAVEAYGAALRAALPPEQPVLVQGPLGRESMLDRFRQNRRAVLVGTDSFWEGVSVKGEGLRLVVIPRLPFRVPTDPLRSARHERIERAGGDPFRAFSLPEAVLRLRQGYGRLIRHRGDRGVVLILDRRLHERWYGGLILRSLPPARRVTGPWRRVQEEMVAFYGGSAGEPAHAPTDVAGFLARARERRNG